jgi:exosortase
MTRTYSYRVLAVLWIASLVFWWPVAVATLGLALRHEAYTHILIVLPISVSLIVLEWTKQAWRPAPSIRAGLVVLALAVLIGVGGLRWGRVDILTGDVRLTIEMLALVTWWIGSFLLCFGRAALRVCIFPLLFLLWLVPLPEIALNHMVSFRQTGTASLARLMLATATVPVAQDGTTLTIPGLRLQIAEQCSSIRSSMMLVVISMVMSYLLLRSFPGRAVVTLAAIPLSIAKNGLRVFTLAVLGAYVDRNILSGPLHHKGGPVFLAVSLACVVGLIWFMRALENRASQRCVAPVGQVGNARLSN